MEKRKTEIENMSLPALLQQLIIAITKYEHKPAKKHGRLIKTTSVEILKRFGYPKKTATELAKKLIEQQQ